VLEEVDGTDLGLHPLDDDRYDAPKGLLKVLGVTDECADVLQGLQVRYDPATGFVNACHNP
jgi:hypothetical protein